MVFPTRGLSETSLTTLADMIENAFGNDDENIVDFGFIHAVILIITRKMCLLDRKVAVKLSPTQPIPQNSNIIIGEIKVSAKGPKSNTEMSKRANTDIPVHKKVQRRNTISNEIDSESEESDQYDLASSSKQTFTISRRRSIEEIEKDSYKDDSKPTKRFRPLSRSNENEIGYEIDKGVVISQKKGSQQTIKLRPYYKSDNDANKDDLFSEKEGPIKTKILWPSDQSEKKEFPQDYLTRSNENEVDYEIDKDIVISQKKGSQQTIKLKPYYKSGNDANKDDLFSEKEGPIKTNILWPSDQSEKKEFPQDYKPDKDGVLSEKEESKQSKDLKAFKGNKPSKQETSTDYNRDKDAVYSVKESSKQSKNIRSDDKSAKIKTSTDSKSDKNATYSEKEGSKQTKGLKPSDRYAKKETSAEFKSEKVTVYSEKEVSKLAKESKSSAKSDIKETVTDFGVNRDEILSQKSKTVPNGTTREFKKAKYNDSPTKSSKKSQEEKDPKSTDPSDATETYTEKILIVERKASTMSNASRDTRLFDRTPHSLATKEQFKKLGDEVKQLQDRFGLTESNSDLLKTLHRTSSFSDPTAILQLSVRLEGVERAINEMMEAIKKMTSGKLASTGVNVPLSTYNLLLTDSSLAPTEPKIPSNVHKLPSTTKKLPTIEPIKGLKTIAEENVKKNFSFFSDTKVLGTDEVEALKLPDTSTILSKEYSKSTKDSKESRTSSRKKTDGSATISYAEFETSLPDVPQEDISTIMQIPEISRGCLIDNFGSSPLTYGELRFFTQKFAESLNLQGKKINDSILRKSLTTIEDMLILGGKLNKVIERRKPLDDIESKVNGFVEHFNKIDVKINKILSQYHTSLQSLQNEVDTKLENMNEALARRQTNNEAADELTSKFVVLLNDIDSTLMFQRMLCQDQNIYLKKLKAIEKRLVDLNDIKANRDEAEEALKSKVSIAKLNGLMTMEHFFALSGHWLKHITDLLQKSDSREQSWQNLIDSLWSKLDDKAHTVHVNALTDDIFKNIGKLEEDLDFMISICKEKPGSKKEKKVINHHEPCISCNNQPTKGPEEFLDVSPKKISSKSSCKVRRRSTDNKEKKLCYYSLPIPHPIEVRPTCARPCVRSHKRSAEQEGLTSSITVQSSKRDEIQQETYEMRPCKECDISVLKRALLTSDEQKENETISLLSKMIYPRGSHIFQKSKESLVSRQRGSLGSVRADLSRKRIISRGRFTDSVSLLTQDESEIKIVNLDENLSLHY